MSQHNQKYESEFIRCKSRIETMRRQCVAATAERCLRRWGLALAVASVLPPWPRAVKDYLKWIKAGTSLRDHKIKQYGKTLFLDMIAYAEDASVAIAGHLVQASRITAAQRVVVSRLLTLEVVAIGNNSVLRIKCKPTRRHGNHFFLICEQAYRKIRSDFCKRLHALLGQAVIRAAKVAGSFPDKVGELSGGVMKKHYLGLFQEQYAKAVKGFEELFPNVQQVADPTQSDDDDDDPEPMSADDDETDESLPPSLPPPFSALPPALRAGSSPDSLQSPAALQCGHPRAPAARRSQSYPKTKKEKCRRCEQLTQELQSTNAAQHQLMQALRQTQHHMGVVTQQMAGMQQEMRRLHERAVRADAQSAKFSAALAYLRKLNLPLLAQQRQLQVPPPQTQPQTPPQPQPQPQPQRRFGHLPQPLQFGGHQMGLQQQSLPQPLPTLHPVSPVPPRPAIPAFAATQHLPQVERTMAFGVSRATRAPPRLPLPPSPSLQSFTAPPQSPQPFPVGSPSLPMTDADVMMTPVNRNDGELPLWGELPMMGFSPNPPALDMAQTPQLYSSLGSARMTPFSLAPDEGA